MTPRTSNSKLSKKLKKAEKKIICEMLEETEGNVSEAARQLKEPERTLWWKIKKHKIDPEDFR